MIGPIVREISCLINASCCHVVHGVVEKSWGGRGARALAPMGRPIRLQGICHGRLCTRDGCSHWAWIGIRLYFRHTCVALFASRLVERMFTSNYNLLVVGVLNR
jgi:hypothetical protein